MIGVQAFMMLGGGLWFLIVGAAISRPYGVLAICGGALLGLVVGVFAGAGETCISPHSHVKTVTA